MRLISRHVLCQNIELLGSCIGTGVLGTVRSMQTRVGSLFLVNLHLSIDITLKVGCFCWVLIRSMNDSHMNILG